MKGSEKQITWANEILKNINKTYDAAAKMPAPDSVRKVMAAQKASINSAEHAGDIISLFGKINFKGDVREDLPWILAVFKTTVPMTTGQEKILMK